MKFQRSKGKNPPVSIYYKVLPQILLCVILISPLYSQVMWNYTYGSFPGNEGSQTIELPGGGYLLCGSATTWGYPDTDFWLERIDISGNTLWTKTYGGDDSEYAHSVINLIQEESFLLAGGTHSYGNGQADIWLVKTDYTGDTLWTRTYGGQRSEDVLSVIETSDSGYLLSGYTYSFGQGSSDAWVIKTDNSGDTLWTHTYGGADFDYISSGIELSSGGYLLAGFACSFGDGSTDGWLIRINHQGDTLWSHTYGYASRVLFESVVECTDGGFLIWGKRDTTSWLLRTDSQGDSLWSKVFNEGWVASDIVHAHDSGYVAVGGVFTYENMLDFWILKVDDEGNTVWSRTYGGDNLDYANKILATSDGGYLLTGYTYSFGSYTQAWLIKTDSLGISDVQLSAQSNGIIHGNHLISLYPNPTNSAINISYSLSELSNVVLTIYNLKGSPVWSHEYLAQNQGSYSYTWPCTTTEGISLNSGIYIFQLRAGGLVESRKLILLK